MIRPYNFKENEIQNIIIRFGKDFYEKVLKDIEMYRDRWTLSSFQLVPSYSANLIFICCSENLGKVVLKISNTSFKEIFTEFNALCEYNSNKFCKVLEADIDNGVILLECIQPGDTLSKEDSLDKRIAVFSSLYEGLHITPTKTDIYPTYISWVSRITEYMSKRNDCIELYLHMKKAKKICLTVSELYSDKKLLHGDFHHDNILIGNDGKYIIIDPKGVIGDPVFDTARFILNEFEAEITTDLYKKINYIINSLSNKLNIPNYILKQCLYVETSMGACWHVESGVAPSEFQRLIEKVAFSESILNN